MEEDTKKSRKPKSNFVYCQGCAEEHHHKDMINICTECVQSKFIPRLNWHEVGFADKKSFDQWWNHTKKVQVDNLTKIIKERREKELLRQQWFDKTHTEEDEMEFDSEDLENFRSTPL